MAWLSRSSAGSVTPGFFAASAAVRFPQQDMAALYHRIRSGQPLGRGLIIEIVAAHAGAGVTAVAHGIGCAAAELAAQRVLFCDATGSGDLLRLAGVSRRDRLADIAAAHRNPAPGEMAACDLDTDRSPSEMLVNIATYATVLPVLRELYDLVVIDVPPSNDSALGAALARHVDAVVGVIEAEKTRAPTIDVMLRNIEANGGKIAGLVLNKRVRHIPARIYRWL